MKLLDDYISLENKIHEYFGYIEQWKVFPLNDCRNYYWYDHMDRSVVFFKANTKEEALSQIESGNFYKNELLSINRKPDYTMICVDTQTDGNKFLSIFDSSKELSKEDCEEFEDYF